ncbi:hypothetical protein B0H14DRAFT_2642814 [Mycena olivaceomarginata]|nr:hypothetical protein B0H14DRAFT_2642814 [Mycena olivaceomarginata]
MTKHKKATSIKIYDDDLNDGSGSDNAATGYTPQVATQQTQQVHHLPEETVSVGADGHLLSTFTQLAVPASPSKRVLQSGPQELCGSDNLNEQWACMDRETFLDELIQRDGRGDHAGWLLWMCLYPVTGTNPRSAATFAALECFDLLTLESKCSAYEFYNSLQWGTDNTGIAPVQECHDKFLCMNCRGHDPSEDRIAATKAGECTLLCPACPHPGKNLPPGWEMVAFDKGHLCAQFLALDTDFQLKCRDVSTEEKDPGLVTGLAFFGEVKKYMAHLDKKLDYKQPRNTCVAHNAVDQPDREFLGTVSSGIGTINCARHNMKRPLGIGDLEKEEWQVMPFEDGLGC